MNKMNTLAFVNFLLVKLFPTLIRQNFPPSKIYAIRYIITVQIRICYTHNVESVTAIIQILPQGIFNVNMHTTKVTI